MHGQRRRDRLASSRVGGSLPISPPNGVGSFGFGQAQTKSYISTMASSRLFWGVPGDSSWRKPK